MIKYIILQIFRYDDYLSIYKAKKLSYMVKVVLGLAKHCKFYDHK